jgi:hypothetical protein
MARVVGVLDENGAGRAYPYDRLGEELVINDTLEDTRIVLFWKAGTASAVDSGDIAEGRDVGATGVFIRTTEDQTLTFAANEDGTFRDLETGSTWDILGEAIAGPLSGTTLTPIPHHDTFWFAWAAFVSPDTLEE